MLVLSRRVGESVVIGDDITVTVLEVRGDVVRIVTTPGDQGEITDREPVTIEATVVGVNRVEETGETVVDVAVPEAEAAELAARAATGRVALVLDARER